MGLLWTGVAQGQIRPSANPAATASHYILETPETGAQPAATQASTAANMQSMSLLDDRRPLQAGDVISFRVVEDAGAPQMLKITDSGDVDAPLVGRISAAGKTCKELANSIKTSLEKEYYNRATVILGLESANAASVGRIYLTGQIIGQGQMDLMANEALTVSKAIVRAGGFGDFADQRRVRLIRTMPDGSTKMLSVDVKEVLTKGRLDKDLPVQPGDIIVVPERAVNF